MAALSLLPVLPPDAVVALLTNGCSIWTWVSGRGAAPWTAC